MKNVVMGVGTFICWVHQVPQNRNVVQMVLCLLLVATLMKYWWWDFLWMKCLSSWKWLLRGANSVKIAQIIITYLQWLLQKYATIVTVLDLQIEVQAIIVWCWVDEFIIGCSCVKLPKIKCPMNLLLSNVNKIFCLWITCLKRTFKCDIPYYLCLL